MTREQNVPGYEEDFVAWLEDQAQHARRGEIDALDRENIAEELEGMARSDRREIRNRLTVLLTLLLKCLLQPWRRSSGWLGTISEQRVRIASVVDDSPSLRTYPATVLNQCYGAARAQAAIETRLPANAFPEACPFGLDDILDIGWLSGDHGRGGLAAYRRE
jgi:Domain of unknown function DUF29